MKKFFSQESLKALAHNIQAVFWFSLMLYGPMIAHDLLTK